MSQSPNEFETVSYEQAVSLVRRHADAEITLVTVPFPGMSLQLTGQLYIQDSGQFAFAVVPSEQMSISVMPFPHCLYQIPAERSANPTALICALPGPEPDQEVMMWMLRFSG